MKGRKELTGNQLPEDDTALTRYLRLDLEARGDSWDAPCSLAFLYEEAGDWRLSSLDIPGFMWLPHPAAGLMRMAITISRPVEGLEFVRDYVHQLRPPGWRGVAFFSESWFVEQKKIPGEEIDPVFKAMAEERMLSTHPAREEVRCWWAALEDGTSVMVSMKRGTGEVMAAVFPPHNQEFIGTIPEALSIMTNALAHA